MNEPDSAKRQHFERLSALLDEALTLPVERRADFVARCEPAELRSELAALLALNDRTGPLDRPPHSVAGEAVAQRRLGRYRLLDPLGEGGMATVWRAEHREGEFVREVAIKCLKTGLATPELRARFLREQQILADLEHPHIARLYDVGISDEGVPFIVMELIDGEPITEYCDRHRLSLRQRLKLFRQVLDAVACTHQSLIVHRDLKPANILITDDGQAKLLDFGIAKALDETDEATRTQMRAMTPGYAAPEQFRGESVTTATDVYALGVILHELLTGIRPDRDTDTDPATAPDPPLASQSLTREPAPKDVAGCRGFGDLKRLSQALHGDLDTLIAGALRPDPARRYRDAAALDAEIERHLFNLPLNVRRASRAYRSAKFLRRNWLAVGAASGIALALVGGAAVALWQAGQARHEAERATVALAQTEQALSRAEALQEFLLDLFRSAQPDRPRDQLPTTEEILALGAERALDEASAPPAERVVMLMTIGDIYRRQGWYDQARPLLDAALALAREHAEQRPEDLAKTLYRRGVLALGARDFDQADSLLLESESVVEGLDAYWNVFAETRVMRAWGEYMKGNYEESIRLSESLNQRMEEGHETDPRIRRAVLNNLATGYKYIGDLETSSRFRREANDLTRQLYGEESLTHAIALGNSIDLEYLLGRFEESETTARHAIALYDQIYDPKHPTAYRAVARRHLALALLYSGRFDEALTELETSNAERAQARDRQVDKWEYHYLNRGTFLARMHRWQEAEQDLQQARELFVDPGPDDQEPLISLDAYLARALCQQNETDEAEVVLVELDERLDGQDFDRPAVQARINEARATCLFKAGSMDLALSEVDNALYNETHRPGHAMHHADRRILRARILAALDRHDEAAQELDLAEQAFLNLDLADHPHFPNIKAARGDLGLD